MIDFTQGPLLDLGTTGSEEGCEVFGFHAIGPDGGPPTAYATYLADAMLYRAAPDLLEMLKRVRMHTSDASNLAGPIDSIIAKAEGRA